MTEAQRLGLKSLDYENDQKSLEVFQYIKDIEIANNWEPVKEHGFYIISKKMGSKYEPNYPISKIWFYLDGRVPLNLVLEELNNPERRVA